MAQLVVRNLEESVKVEIQRLAKQNGRSMEEEVRHILRKAGKEFEDSNFGLGTQIANRFRGIGVKLERLPRELPRPAVFSTSDHPRYKRSVRADGRYAKSGRRRLA